MFKHLKLKLIALAVLLIGVVGAFLRFSGPAPLDVDAFNALYERPAPTTDGPMKVFHLGHSLVSNDMPAMLMQLAGEDHSYETQKGWGAFLKAHWDPDQPLNGFDEENGHPRYRDAKEAMASGEYTALVMTEAVEIRDSIKYMDSGEMLHNWDAAARAGNPAIKTYFYETWHELDDPEGWLERLDRDLEKYWEGEILRRALNYDDDPQPIYMIPGGQVMARFVREIESRGGVGELKTRQDLFSDNIHFNDIGAYLVTLTHYAVLYQKSPVGLPHELRKADGSPATAPSSEVARLMQEIVWEVVTSYDKTGVRAPGS